MKGAPREESRQADKDYIAKELRCALREFRRCLAGNGVPLAGGEIK